MTLAGMAGAPLSRRTQRALRAISTALASMDPAIDHPQCDSVVVTLRFSRHSREVETVEARPVYNYRLAASGDRVLE